MIETSDDLLRHWLLHRLPAQEAQALEERLLHDENFAAHLRSVETDLLDDFAQVRLRDADRDAVVNHLLATPRDRDRLRIAAALAHIAGAGAPPRTPRAVRRAATPPPARWSPRSRRVAAAGVLASACAVLIAVVGLRDRDGIEKTVTPDAVATITLLADQQRGAQVEEIRIPRGAVTIRLQVEVGAAAPLARYTLNIADGARTLFSAQDLVPHEAAPYHFVEVTFAARTLAGGAHRVRVASQGASASETTWSIRTRTE